MTVDGEALDKTKFYTVATGNFVTNGGDLYTDFLGSELVKQGREFATVLTEYFKNNRPIGVPERGRLIPR